MRNALLDQLPQPTLTKAHVDALAQLIPLPITVPAQFLRKNATLGGLANSGLSESAKLFMALALICVNPSDAASPNLADFAEILIALNRKANAVETKDQIVACVCCVLTTEQIISLFLLLAQKEKIFLVETATGFCRGSELYSRLAAQFLDKMGEPFLEEFTASLLSMENIVNIDAVYTEEQLSAITSIIARKKEAERNAAIRVTQEELAAVSAFERNIVDPIKNIILRMGGSVPTGLKTLLYESKILLEARSERIFYEQRGKEELPPQISKNLRGTAEQLQGLFLLKFVFSGISLLVDPSDRRLSPLQKQALQIATPLLQKMATVGDEDLNRFVFEMATKEPHPQFLPSSIHPEGDEAPMLGILPMAALPLDEARILLDPAQAQSRLARRLEETPRSDHSDDALLTARRNSKPKTCSTREKVGYSVGGALTATLPAVANSEVLIKWGVAPSNPWVQLGPYLTSGIAATPGLIIIILLLLLRCIRYCANDNNVSTVSSETLPSGYRLVAPLGKNDDSDNAATDPDNVSDAGEEEDPSFASEQPGPNG